MSNDSALTGTSDVLTDVQNLPDKRGIAIQQVGVNSLRYPLIWHETDGSSQASAGVFSLGASLDADHRGTHMSRFVEHLQKAHMNVSMQQWFDFPRQLAQALGARQAQASVTFSLFREVQAPVTGSNGMQEIGVALSSRWFEEKDLAELHFGITVPVATVCPCSKSISERGAHNQRGTISVSGWLLPSASSSIRIDALASAIESCASVPLYPVLKRSDEKQVTEQGYDQAKFVEDVARDTLLMLREQAIFSAYKVVVENMESIHSHNAFAEIQEGNCE